MTCIRFNRSGSLTFVSKSGKTEESCAIHDGKSLRVCIVPSEDGHDHVDLIDSRGWISYGIPRSAFAVHLPVA
jgi:hypothetical protein